MCKSSNAIAAIRDGLTYVIKNPRNQIRRQWMVQLLVEQMFLGYENPDNPEHNMC